MTDREGAFGKRPPVPLSRGRTKVEKMKQSHSATYGQMLAKRMANQKPMTKRAILSKWPAFTSVWTINLAIDWIEANTSTSDNPFLFVWDRGEAVWGFRSTFEPVRANVLFNVSYLLTRAETTQQVLDHAINSPVVTMTPSELRACKGLNAQLGGVVAYLQSTAEELAKL